MSCEWMRSCSSRHLCLGDVSWQFFRSVRGCLRDALGAALARKLVPSCLFSSLLFHQSELAPITQSTSY
ncbi:hypothetical protein M433DRAFT_189898 [Acidomyces richmondensis BFW]|nr:hypothetical protein M433DRAFT_189898 [Acidomyces richmondensis BFW]